MAVGGAAGVCLPSTSAAGALPAVEGWGRQKATGPTRRGLSIRCNSVGAAGGGMPAAGGLAEDHYRTLRLRPGATRGEVKKAFRRLTLLYHPDVCKHNKRDEDAGVDFQRINVAYQMLMSNMREADERLEYWRLKYGLTDEDLDRYRYYVNDQVHDDDEWLHM